MFDVLVDELSERYGLGDRGRDLFGLLMGYIHNDRRGGFGGFVEGFREQGHGELLSSWLGNADAGGLNASDVGTVFGQGLLNDWGSRLGVSRATVAAAIAGVLPRLMAEMTPGGRLPGGFAPVSPQPMADTASAATRRAPESRDSDTFRSRPGVDGLLSAEEPRPPAPASAQTMADTRWARGRDEPIHNEPIHTERLQNDRTHDERIHQDAPLPEPDYFDLPRTREPASQSLRREPVFAPDDTAPPAAAVRTPVESRRMHEAPPAPALDPADQRLADMTAAFDRPERGGSRGSAPSALADVRPEGWRSAVHPPKRQRSGWGWLVWLFLLGLLAGGAWYAWTLGLLDPYIVEYALPIQTSR